MPVDVGYRVLLDDFGGVVGLKEVLDGICGLVNSSLYGDLMFVSLDNIKDPDVKMGHDEELSLLEKCAFDNLSNFPLRLPFTPLVGIKDFLVVYSFIASFYYLRLGHKLDLEERNKVFYSDTATRILLLLEDFDSTMETPEPTSEFFKKLGKVKWADSRSKDLFNRVTDLGFKVMDRKLGSKYSISLSVNENAFILLLSGCGAVLDGRDRISMDDVVRAYNMYFKLLNTNITRLM